MPRSRKPALIGALLIPVVAGGFILQSRERREGAVLLQQVMSLVSERFVDTLPTSDVYEKAAEGLVRELNDPYSELMTPRDVKQFNSRTNGRYGGLGMSIEFDTRANYVRVATVYPNTPAEAAGIRDVLAKSLGSSNHANVVKATIAALRSLRRKDQIFKLRGILSRDGRGESHDAAS